MVLAVQAVKANQLNVSEAARAYNVNRSTLWQHCNGKYRNSPKAYKWQNMHLTEKEELAVVEMAKTTCRIGTPITRQKVMDFAMVIKTNYFF